MKTSTLMDIIKMGNFSVSKFFLQNYRNMGLTSDEFIFVSYLLNEGNEIVFDVEKIANDLGTDKNFVFAMAQTLKEKNIIEMIVKKNDKKIIGEFITLNNFYDKLSVIVLDYINNDNQEKSDHNIYELFEKEFGRTLSPMEYEIINAWIQKNIKEELIVEALKEAAFNGVANLRYIDKILYEWEHKGFKSVQDVKNHQAKYKKDKKEKVELFDYNWLDDEEK